MHMMPPARPGQGEAASTSRTFPSSAVPSAIRRPGRLPLGAFTLLLVSPLLAMADASAPGPSLESTRRTRDFPVREARYELDLRVDVEGEKLYADVHLTVENHTDEPAPEVPLLLYRLLTVRDVKGADGADLAYHQEVTASERSPRKQVNYVRIQLPAPLIPGERTTLRIVYDGFLAGYTETGARYVRDHVGEPFTILRQDAHAYPEVGRPGTRWPGLPSYEYRAVVSVPSGYVVANGGELMERTRSRDGVTYVYRNMKPAWRMDFAIARYGTLEFEDGRFRVHYLPGDSVGGARVLDAVRRSLHLYEGWFGPLREPPRLAVIEIPDGYGSQKDVTSILQTAAAFRDPDRVYEVYHEVSHFWNVPPTDAPSPRLEEGLASYLEDVATEELDGKRQLEPAVARLEGWVRSTFAENPRFEEIPLADYGREDVTGLAYGVGELMFYALGEIVGPRTLRRIIGGYYQRYAGSGAGVSELAAFADEVTEVDLALFFRDWLFTTRWYDHLASGGTTAGYAAAYGLPGRRAVISEDRGPVGRDRHWKER